MIDSCRLFDLGYAKKTGKKGPGVRNEQCCSRNKAWQQSFKSYFLFTMIWCRLDVKMTTTPWRLLSLVETGLSPWCRMMPMETAHFVVGIKFDLSWFVRFIHSTFCFLILEEFYSTSVFEICRGTNDCRTRRIWERFENSTQVERYEWFWFEFSLWPSTIGGRATVSAIVRIEFRAYVKTSTHEYISSGLLWSTYAKTYRTYVVSLYACGCLWLCGSFRIRGAGGQTLFALTS